MQEQKVGAQVDLKSVPAKAVDPKRISLPVEAAVCNPSDHLFRERAEVLNDLSKIVLPNESCPPVLPRSCHWIGKG